MLKDPRLKPEARVLGWLMLMTVLAGPLAGCSSPVDRAVATSIVPEDYHERHPVVLTDAPHRLDIFFVGASGRLDNAQEKQVEAFAREYLGAGEGVIHVAMPSGPVDHAAAELTLEAVRRTLLRFGVRNRVVIEGYRVADPALAAPLHLSFVTLQARAGSRCGEWPDDLGSGSTLATWRNRSYYNLGCATQQTLAAQVADPRDLVKPRAEDPTDVQLRTRAIGDLREGKDPSTTWINNPSPIGAVGGF